MPCQIQGSSVVPLQELLNKTKEINKALNKKIGLEDALKQLNTIKTEQKCEDAEEEGGERGPQWSHGQLRAVQVEYQLVVLTSTQERRKGRNS